MRNARHIVLISCVKRKGKQPAQSQDLYKMKIADVKAWAGIVLQQLGEVADLGNDRFTVLASDRYRRFLLPHLAHHSVPMKGMRIGKQLQFLKEKVA